MVSIIIPAYNCEKTIPDTLRSIERQDYRDFEVIVINDGSTDGTKDTVLSYQKTCGYKIELITQENGGPGTARNCGIEHSHGEYLVFVDSDDLIAEDYLSTLMKGLSDQIDFCFAQYYKITDHNEASGQVVKSELTGVCDPEDVFASFICNKTHISVWSSMFKREVIERNGLRFLDHCFSGEDVEFISRYLMCCEKVRSIEKTVYTFFFESKRSQKRNITTGITDIRQSVYWPLLDELKTKQWHDGYGALAYGKFPVMAVLEIVYLTSLFDSRKSFAEGYRQKFSALIDYSKNMDRKYLPMKTFFKYKLLYYLLVCFPATFFEVAKRL